MYKMLITSMLALGLIASPALAQEVAVTEPVDDSMTMSQEGIVSLDFRDADIKNVLKVLAFKSGVNIVPSPDVSGIVTIQLNDVPWQEALEVILETYGYAYDQKGNIILVTTIDGMKKRREDAMLLAEQEPLMTETFTLNFGVASEIIASVEKMRSDRGRINYDERTNTIIVTDVSRKIKLIDSVIKKLDTTTPQVLIEAKIVETNLNDNENLGIDWLTQASITGSARPIIWPFDNETDKRFAPGSFPTPTDSDFSLGTLDFSQVQAVLQLLKSRTDTNILSNPRIVTLDNQPARIQVGTDHPIPSYAYNEEQATLQVNGFEWKTIGINFLVTPHVNNAGYVTLEVKPEVSELAGTVPFDNIDLPRISKEEAETNVMVKDGETLVIAGLITDKKTDIKKKTPFMGDIPFIGYFFKKSEVEITKSDIIIFITPHIITPEIASSE